MTDSPMDKIDAVAFDRLPITVTVTAPFITRGLEAGALGLDMVMARAVGGDARYIIPGTLLAGVLRGALEAVANRLEGKTLTLAERSVDVGAWTAILFGRKSGEGAVPSDAADSGRRTGPDGWRVDNEPLRGTVSVSDLVIADDSWALAQAAIKDAAPLTRVAIDPDRGAAREGQLLFIESPFKIGQPVTFRGDVVLRRSSDFPAAAVRELLLAALSHVPAIGAMKSAGFGRIEGFSIEPAPPIKSAPRKDAEGRDTPAAPSATAIPAGSTVEVTYSVDRPFLIDARVGGGNEYIGAEIIPGGAIKGTLAAALVKPADTEQAKCHRATLNRALAETLIGHAYPVPPGADSPRGRALPITLALHKAGDTLTLYDVARAGATEGAKLPPGLRFVSDWKGDEEVKVRRYLGWAGADDPDLLRDVRTRTAIDPRTGSADYDEDQDSGRLFSDSAVSPVCTVHPDTKDQPARYLWRGRLTLPETEDQTLCDLLVKTLSAGVPHFGKTGAVLTATSMVVKDEAGTKRPDHQADHMYVLTLETPALLNDLDALREGRPVGDDYAAWFEQHGLDLDRAFAEQRLAGGYLALRYPPRLDRYEPYLLTEPGAVFVVRERTPGAVAAVLRSGLRPRMPHREATWCTCPFMSENGYGAVAVDVVDHARLATGDQITGDAAASGSEGQS